MISLFEVYNFKIYSIATFGGMAQEKKTIHLTTLMTYDEFWDNFFLKVSKFSRLVHWHILLEFVMMQN